MSFRTRCKFNCESIIRSEGQETIEFRAVGSGRANGEDESFSEYTPWGELSFTVTNPAILGQFRRGSDYYLDIVPTTTDEKDKEA